MRIAFLLSVWIPALAAQTGAEKPVYLDSSAPVDRRVEDLLGRMTLKEKVGQLNMPCVYVNELGKDIPAKLAACRRFAEGTYTTDIGPGGGFFTLADNILPEGSRQQALYFNELQTIALEKTRLKIPLLQTEEGTHGVMCSGKTIFPEGPGLGSTWNLDLVRDIYAAAAREARAVGIHQLFTLVVEPNRDPRLGRNAEGYSEDPYLCARFAETIVRAAQGSDISAPDKVVAGLCHYPGQSQPVSGFERGAMEISERVLREVFLPPWVAGVKRAGALGVMATYPAIDGIPAHASHKILTGILREELAFQGLVLGEGGGIGTLVYERLAPTQKEAGQLAIRAGVDVGISYESGYMGEMIRSVEEGRISMADIDRSVRRVLRLKFALGLFERPFGDPERAARVTHTKEHQDLAYRAARESIVLLKNDGVLPLRKGIRSIAVIGPNADDKRNQLGDYVSRHIPQEIVTVLAGIRQKAPGAKVAYAKGCDVLGEDRNGFAEAVEAAKAADAAVVVVGENAPGNPGKPATIGEGYDVASLDLTGVQEELVRAIQATGKPTVVVLINGRALSIRWIAEHVPAVVEAWLPGEKGGLAVADVLFGDYNPSGRLPVTVPRHSGQLPVYYNSKPSKEYWIKEGWGRRYADMSPWPLWDFGHGLGYTKFEYANLRITPAAIGSAGEVEVKADVRNAGDREGQEVVQLYIHDPVATVVRPIKELKGFEKISLKPGESKTVAFKLGPEELSFLNERLDRVVEPGAFQAMVGSSSSDIRLTGSFEVTP
ncbi:MAG: glycoside hydrolase family 3 C-terminal domain-containing protein [Bryobacteraceae bacterium]|nr:glycoside hydrolase family 3 C-terminal domain-containing protein [Bryobacteraceae bacterium]